MKRTIGLVIFVTLFFLPGMRADSDLRADRGWLFGHSEYVPGELLIKYKSHVSVSSRRALARRLGVETVKDLPASRMQQVRIPLHAKMEEVLADIRRHPHVEYAEPNYYRYSTATVPNDAYFSYLWGLMNTGQQMNGTPGTFGADIRASEAWDITTGNGEMVIGVIDTGIDEHHPDLAENLWSDGQGSHGWNFIAHNGNIMDPNGHGTHIAGIIAARGNNGLGVAGVCWRTKVMALKAINAFGITTVADSVSAIDYARNQGVKVLNASYSGSTYSQTEYEAISRANDSGILFVTAAGNSGTDNDRIPRYPANYNLPNILSVAATNQNDDLSTYSNYGASSVDVAAPGNNIYSLKLARRAVWTSNFDSGSLNGWSTGGTGNLWGISSSHSSSGPYSLATNPSGNYRNMTDSWARMPALNLSSERGTKLEFKLRGSSEPYYDFIYVEISNDGSDWVNKSILVNSVFSSGISGTTLGNWVSATVDLGPHDGVNPLYIRFHFVSDAIYTDEGWSIDEIAVTAASSSYSGVEYEFKNGTSMATAYVSGLAALIWGFDPQFTLDQVKNAILNGVDKKASLQDKVSTSGRVNAIKAIYFLPSSPPEGLQANAASASQINLSWRAKSGNEMGFKIERQEGGQGNFLEIAAVQAGISTYTDTGLNPSTTYAYRLSSYNYSGDFSYSPEAKTTTFASPDGGGGGGGGCFIAAAAFDSPLSPYVAILKEFRDIYLQPYNTGRYFLKIYYHYSPPVAVFLREHQMPKIIVRFLLLPLVAFSYGLLHLKLPFFSILLFSILFLFLRRSGKGS